MKKLLRNSFFRPFVPAAFLFAALGTPQKLSAQQTPALCPLPTDLANPVTFEVFFNNGANACAPRNNSYFDLHVQGGGDYLAWCSDSVANISVSHHPLPCGALDKFYTTTHVYDSLALSCPNPPPSGISQYIFNPGADSKAVPNCNGTVNTPSACVWNQINYLLNHKVGTNPDAVQAAIWDLISPASQESLDTLPSFAVPLPASITPAVAAQAAIDRCTMFNDALAHGSGFVPIPGQVRAVVLYVDDSTQFLFVEVNCACGKTPPSFTKTPGDKDLGCNPTTIPTCDSSQVSVTDNSGSGLQPVNCSVGADVVTGCVHKRQITYSVTDNCGNTAKYVQNITWKVSFLVPATPPTDVTGQCDSDVPTAGPLSASDGCDGQITVSPTDNKVLDTSGCGYTITRTWSFKDSCGNQASVSQKIRIKDTTAPTISSVPAGGTVACGTTFPSDSDVKGAVKATDNCSTPTINVSHVDTVSGCQTTRTFTITATDACGNPATKTVTYTMNCCTDLTKGDTATIGFWHNKNGQALILGLNGGPSSKQLATWLATTFPCMYGVKAPAGNNLTGKSNTDVAALFMKFFGVQGQKTDAQILGGALASYVTSSTLAGNNAAQYGFNVSTTGTGGKSFNVGSDGAAIGLSNNTSYSVMDLLIKANALECGGLSSAAANALNNIFDGINQKGDI